MNNNLINYLLHLADNNLILSQRNAEWCGHGPVLEQDIAITNMTLDLLGQARNFYQYAAELSGNGATEDSFAYLRDNREFRNFLLAEQPNGDWAQTILRQFFFSAFQYFLYGKLVNSSDTQIAAIAEKSLKEVIYHLRWSSEWVIRLGDGTEESHKRMLNAIDALWQYTGEMFLPAPYETLTAESGYGADVAALKNEWLQKINSVFHEAGLPQPPADVYMHTGGKTGMHTEYLGHILSDLQFMQRAYPGMEW